MKKASSWIIFFFLICCRVVYAQTTIAVASFDTKGVILLVDAKFVTGLFIKELLKNERIKIIEGSHFEKIVDEMKFQIKDWTDNRKMEKLGAVISADYVIRGEIIDLNNIYYITAHIIDVKTAKVLHSVKEELRYFDEIPGMLPLFSRRLLSGIPGLVQADYFTGD